MSVADVLSISYIPYARGSREESEGNGTKGRKGGRNKVGGEDKRIGQTGVRRLRKRGGDVWKKKKIMWSRKDLTRKKFWS